MSEFKHKQVIIIRKDLSMRLGKCVAQGSHASLHSYQKALKMFPDITKEWDELGCTKICVYVKSEEELISIYGEAVKAKIPCALIRDAGLTEFKGIPTLTCCAIGPYKVDEIDKITKHLPLL